MAMYAVEMLGEQREVGERGVGRRGDPRLHQDWVFLCGVSKVGKGMEEWDLNPDRGALIGFKDDWAIPIP